MALLCILNGHEVVRSNMPTGTIGFNTLAATNVAADAERTYFSYSIPVSSLLTGRNVLAVELHQANVTSYDTSFDLRLKGTLRSSLTASALSDGSQTPTTPAPASNFPDELKQQARRPRASGDSAIPQPQLEPNRAGSAATAAGWLNCDSSGKANLPREECCLRAKRWRECLAIGHNGRLRGRWPRPRGHAGEHAHAAWVGTRL